MPINQLIMVLANMKALHSLKILDIYCNMSQFLKLAIYFHFSICEIYWQLPPFVCNNSITKLEYVEPKRMYVPLEGVLTLKVVP